MRAECDGFEAEFTAGYLRNDPMWNPSVLVRLPESLKNGVTQPPSVSWWDPLSQVGNWENQDLGRGLLQYFYLLVDERVQRDA